MYKTKNQSIVKYILSFFFSAQLKDTAKAPAVDEQSPSFLYGSDINFELDTTE